MKRLIAILFAVLPLSASAQLFGGMSQDNPDFQRIKFEQFFNYLNGKYVDTLNSSKLVENAIINMLSELDPHSSYSSAEEMKSLNESFSGSFSGIGVEFDVINDTIMVVNTIVGGPSESIGILPGDRIVTIDGKSAIGVSRADVPKLLRGAKGSNVNLEVVRRSSATPLTFKITRDDIPLHTVDAAYMLRPGIGYIKVNRFAQTTMQEFNEAFRKMGAVDALVLDLRGNGGGLMDQAIEMSEFFLPAGSVIVSTEGRKVKSVSYRSRNNGTFTNGRLVVLIDSSSASGSEIVAGAIQDWDRGVIIGQPSFGKGLVQQQLPLIDGSAVRITVARYHTPSGRVIQRPFENGDTESYYLDHLKRTLDNSYIDSLNQNAPVYKTLRTGRKVLGGGGIYPDILVQLDTTHNYSYWNRLIGNSIVNEYINTYLEKHRDYISLNYPNFEIFYNDFHVTTQMLNEIKKLGAERNIRQEDGDAIETLPDVGLYLKALMARKLWGSNEYFRTMNTDDPELQKALEIITNPTAYQTILASQH